MWRQAGTGLQTGEGEGSLEGRCISASLPGQNRLSWEHYLPPPPPHGLVHMEPKDSPNLSIQPWVGHESEVALSCPTLCNPMDCSLPGSSVQGTFQARILEWVAVPSPGDFLDPGTEPGSPTL